MNRLYVKYLVFSFACVYVLASCKQSIEEQAKVETSDTVVSSQVQSTTLIEATESWDGTPLPDYLERGQCGLIVRFFSDLADQLTVHNFIIFIQYQHSTSRYPS